MLSNNKYGKFDPELIKRVRRKAQDSFGALGSDACGIEDVEQDLISHLIRVLPDHNPKKCSRNAFIERSMTDYVSDVARKRHTHKREHIYKKYSYDQLTDPPVDGRGSDFKDEKVRRDLYQHASHKHSSNTLEGNVREEIDEAGLTPEELQLCVLLTEYPLLKAAAMMGITRERSRQITRSIRKKWEMVKKIKKVQPISERNAG